MLSQPVCKADSEVSRVKSHADGIPLFAIKGAVKAEGEISVCAPRAVYLELGTHVYSILQSSEIAVVVLARECSAFVDNVSCLVLVDIANLHFLTPYLVSAYISVETSCPFSVSIIDFLSVCIALERAVVDIGDVWAETQCPSLVGMPGCLNGYRDAYLHYLYDYVAAEGSFDFLSSLFEGYVIMAHLNLALEAAALKVEADL